MSHSELKKPSKLALPVILIAVFVVPIAITGTAVALPRIATNLGTNPMLLQGVVNGFNASFALFMLVWGFASDRIGYKTTFALGAVLMALGSAISAAAPNLWVLDVGRIVSGIAGAAVFAGASATLSNAFPPEERERNFAIFGSTLGLGGTVGPTLAGWLIPVLGWRGVFGAFGVVAAIALLLIRYVPRVPRLNLAGRKFIDLSLLKNPAFLMFALVPVADAFGFMTIFTYLPVALHAQHGLDVSAAGTLLLLMTVPVLIGPVSVAFVMKRYPKVTAMAIIYTSLVLLLLGDLGMFLFVPSLPIAWIFGPMILLGFAMGLPIGLVDGAALGVVPPESSGTAAGVLNFLRLGSEAVVIGVYAAGTHSVIKHLVGDSALADKIAAGAQGHSQIYADAFRTVLYPVIGFTVVTALVIVRCHRLSLRAKSSAS